jgi:hypothetical protein
MTGTRVGFAELAKRLNAAGIEENERNLRNKIARGEMQASFFLICLRLLGCDYLSIREMPLLRDAVRTRQNKPKEGTPTLPEQRAGERPGKSTRN